MPRMMSASSSGALIRLMPTGICASKPDAIRGAVIMKMISSTSITSAIGVTLMSALTAALPLLADMATAGGHLGREVLGERRATELAADALDQVVDELLATVDHLDRQEVHLGLEVVVDPDRGDRDEETERRGDERLGDAGRDRREATRAAARGHAGERVHDAHRRAEQADERRRGAHGAPDAAAALHLGPEDQWVALG